MRRLAHALLLGLLGAGIVHVAVLLLLPLFSEQDAWARLSAAAEPYAAVRVDGRSGRPPLLADLDPLFAASACRFNLTDGALRATAGGRVPFWSASVYGRDGRNLFSLNDRSGPGDGLDIVVLTSAQLAERDTEAAEPDRAIPVEVETAEGFLLVRAFVPDESWSKRVDEFLGGLSCAVE